MSKYQFVSSNAISHSDYYEFDRRCSNDAVAQAFNKVSTAAEDFKASTADFAFLHKKSVETCKDRLKSLKDSITQLEQQLGWNYESHKTASTAQPCWDAAPKDPQ